MLAHFEIMEKTGVGENGAVASLSYKLQNDKKYFMSIYASFVVCYTSLFCNIVLILISIHKGYKRN